MTIEDDAEKADDLERHSRILDLAKVILNAGNALDAEDWQRVESYAKEAGRMARVLKMLDAKSKQ